MSFRSSTDSLRSSSDSDGPCVVLHPQDPLASQAPLVSQAQRSRTKLSTSLDSIITGVSNLLRAPSPQLSSTLVTQPLLPLPAAIAAAPLLPLPAALQTIPNYVQLLKTINLLSPALQFAERVLRCQEASKFENIAKNRYNDYLPTDPHLAKLPNDRYINASHFNDLIITQGPLSTTLEDFWLMLFHHKATHLISLTNHSEQKETQTIIKTFPFWNPSLKPTLAANETLFESPQVKVILIALPEVALTPPQGSTQRVIKQLFAIVHDGETLLIQHWHFLDWLDHQACNPQLLVEMIEAIMSSSPQRKCAIHCSAGIGRAGTFAVLYSACLRYLATKLPPTESDISTLIVQLRQARPGSVMTPQQLELIFDALALFIQRNKLA